MRIALIEDESIYRETFVSLIDKYKKEHKEYIIELDVFSMSYLFLDNFKTNYDLIFADIELPDLNGIELTKKIRQIDKETFIVFLTNLSQYALKGYEVRAFDYILKPLKYERLSYVLDRIFEELNKHNNEFLSIKTTAGFVKLRHQDIVYISVDDHLVYLHSYNKEYECWDSLKNIEKILPSINFMRISKSAILNLSYLQTMGSKTITLTNGIELPYSNLLKNAIMDRLNRLV